MQTPVPAFAYLGNHLALDFVNTELVAGGERTDLLHSDADLLRWAHQGGLLREPPEPPARSRRDPRIPALRAALRSLFEAAAAGKPPGAEALAALNAWLTRPRRPPPLVSRGGLYQRAPQAPSGATTVPEVLQAVADTAAELLASDRLRLLRRCANGHCILLFLDQSRAGRRRWCSMDVCGNRAKVAAYHRRATRARTGG